MIPYIVASQRREVHQMDRKGAFLPGDLQEELYMQQSPRSVQDGPTPNSLPTTERTIPARCRYHIALYKLMHLRVHLRLNQLRTVSQLRETRISILANWRR